MPTFMSLLLFVGIFLLRSTLFGKEWKPGDPIQWLPEKIVATTEIPDESPSPTPPDEPASPTEGHDDDEGYAEELEGATRIYDSSKIAAASYSSGRHTGPHTDRNSDRYSDRYSDRFSGQHSARHSGQFSGQRGLDRANRQPLPHLSLH